MSQYENDNNVSESGDVSGLQVWTISNGDHVMWQGEAESSADAYNKAQAQAVRYADYLPLPLPAYLRRLLQGAYRVA